LFILPQLPGFVKRFSGFFHFGLKIYILNFNILPEIFVSFFEIFIDTHYNSCYYDNRDLQILRKLFCKLSQ